MAIENSASKDSLSTFVDSINIFDSNLSGVVMILLDSCIWKICLVNLFFWLDQTQKEIYLLCETDKIYKTFKITKWARKNIFHDVLLWCKEIPSSVLFLVWFDS